MRQPTLASLGMLVLTSCFIVRGTDTATVNPRAAETYSVLTHVKAHLADGSTVLYPRGITIRNDSVVGPGTRYDLSLADAGPVASIPIDSVVAMESFHSSIRPTETILLSTAATAGAFALGIAIACAVDPKCFGSCPTVYSDSAGTAVLEAEGFSYSIAPLFERRDVDRLRAQPDAAGMVHLEVRNEALETHFINHVELLSVRHAPDEWVTTDYAGHLVAVRALQAPTRAVDRAGRNVAADLAAHDGRFFQTDSGTLAAATPGDLEDWIDLDVPVPTGADSVALVFRMRNSLLATVLLYDLMLGDRGPRALDWMARDLAEIAPAVNIGRWAVKQLGLRLFVWDGRTYRPAGRIGDSGPVAWKDVVAVVPTLGRPVARIRLRFAADNWRVDRVAATTVWRRVNPQAVALHQIIDPTGHADTAALAALAAPDERYVESPAGRWLRAEFAVAPVAPGEARTLFLAWQGYYIEWLRREWLAGRDSTTFAPGPNTLFTAMRRWQSTQADTERRFYATRVPVR